MELQIRVSSGGVAAPDLAEELRIELDQSVGETRRLQAAAAPGAKGGGMVEAAQLAVLILSAPAVPKLIDLIGGFLQRDRRTEFEFEGPRGKVRLNVADRGAISREDIAAAIRAAVGAPEDHVGGRA